ncbi:hypothetical protein GCM10010423_07520 [Streptomyces levis]|uniref:Uncharacterized protein n=1 Tax=Streptomyces levis TaxID=285566 RepID=A0ABN3NDJ3_9ACTN
MRAVGASPDGWGAWPGARRAPPAPVVIRFASAAGQAPALQGVKRPKNGYGSYGDTRGVSDVPGCRAQRLQGRERAWTAGPCTPNRRNPNRSIPNRRFMSFGVIGLRVTGLRATSPGFTSRKVRNRRSLARRFQTRRVQTR